MMKILVTGGCGYIGSVLVPRLLDRGHEVTVLDAQWFGRNLDDHERLDFCNDDIRNIQGSYFTDQMLKRYDCCIHLAAVANDPCGDLDPKVTWEVNALATMQLADACARAHVPRFIYASSGSVYGVKQEEEVTEDLELVPISEYNKTKMVAERVVLSYSDRMIVQVLRPATVCGYSPRTRLDVAVNALTISALTTGEIKVFGGQQMRPNLHIEDMVDAYIFMLADPMNMGVWNIGFENLTIREIAGKVQRLTHAPVTKVDVIDERSYRLSSKKICDLGFRQRHTVNDAIGDLLIAYRAGYLKDTDNGYNLRSMPR